MNDEMPDAFEDSEFGWAPGVMVGGPLDGQRHDGQTVAAAPKSHNLTLGPSGRLVAAGHIETLAPGEVFVFGSNRHGKHGSGAASVALARFGAVYGQGRGLQGRSYAIITMTWPAFLAREVEEFCRYAARHPEITFLVAEIGCNKAGYTPAQVAPLFAGAPANVALPVSFASVLDNSMPPLPHRRARRTGLATTVSPPPTAAADQPSLQTKEGPDDHLHR